MLFSRYIQHEEFRGIREYSTRYLQYIYVSGGIVKMGEGCVVCKLWTPKAAQPKRIAAAFTSWQNQSEKGDGSEDSYEKTAIRLLTNAAPPC